MAEGIGIRVLRNRGTLFPQGFLDEGVEALELPEQCAGGTREFG